MSLKKFLFLLVCVGLSACGGESNGTEFDTSISTNAFPYINRVNPNNGQAGDTITVFGFGFSNEPANNIIHIGGASVSAATYALVDPIAAGEIEQITFAVPAEASVGATTVLVTVFDNAGNNDTAFTVNP